MSDEKNEKWFVTEVMLNGTKYTIGTNGSIFRVRSPDSDLSIETTVIHVRGPQIDCKRLQQSSVRVLKVG